MRSMTAAKSTSGTPARAPNAAAWRASASAREERMRKRQVELRQDLYLSLSKQLESARIEEVNDTPTITTIDSPFASTRPDGPGILALAVIGLVIGVAARAGRLVLVGR